MASKPKNWNSLSPVEQEAWRVKERERQRKRYEANRDKVLEACCKYYEANPEKRREKDRKYREANSEKAMEAVRKSKQKTLQQTAADQFFIMAGAAEQLTKLKPKQ